MEYGIRMDGMKYRAMNSTNEIVCEHSTSPRSKGKSVFSGVLLVNRVS